MIPYGRQDVTEDDIRAVVDVLNSDFLTQGPQVPAFETAVAKATGAGHAVAVNSATSALHIACLALGLGKGDLMWDLAHHLRGLGQCRASVRGRGRFRRYRPRDLQHVPRRA